MRFEGKTALIVGGNSGIGLASARAFGTEGARVILTGRDQKTIDAAVAEIPDARGYRADIADTESMTPVIEQIRDLYGKLNVLFVNAGVGGFAPVREVSVELWNQIHDVNLRGCFFAVQKALPLLSAGGAIVISGSIGSVLALPGNAAYAAAKAGLRAVARILAKELVTEGIRVNMVSPGPTETPLINRNPGMSEAEVDGLRQQMIAAVPMHRMGVPEEIAAPVLFLASDEASFITGVELYVDGGCVEL